MSINRAIALPTLDIIVPVYNEQEVLGLLFSTLRREFSPAILAVENITSVQFIFVDDGSTDGSAEMIFEEIQKGFPATLIRLSRNFGHQNALGAGFSQATADIIAVIDADLQDPPELILEMIRWWRQDFDVIHAVRRNRKESFIKRFSYWLAYRLIRLVSEIDLPLDSGDFSLMDRRVLAAMERLPEKCRFPRFLRSWVGFRQMTLPYDRGGRAAGSSKYNFRQLYALLAVGLTTSGTRLLRISQLVCACFLILAFFLTCIALQKYFSYPRGEELALWSLFGYALIAICSFVQVFLLAIISTYMGNIYREVKGRPSYLVMEVIGGKSGDVNKTREIHDTRAVGS